MNLSVVNHVMILQASVDPTDSTRQIQKRGILWNRLAFIYIYIYIAALALTDHSYSIEFFQTNQQNPSPTIELYIVIYTSAP
jgi:hypothetical protein